MTVNPSNFHTVFMLTDSNQQINLLLRLAEITDNMVHVQGDPNQNLKFILALTLKVSISDPGLVKPKCVWELSVLFSTIKIFQKT